MLKKDYQYCKNVIKAHSSSFYRAFRKLPKMRADAVFAIYAFCRRVDDFADVLHSESEILSFRKQFEAMLQGQVPNDPMFRALADSFQRFSLQPKPFFEMIEGQLWDLELSRVQTMNELERYCYLVAGTVGLMLLPITCDQINEEVISNATLLGSAMQYTNILRDVMSDGKRNRIYLPMELLETYGLTELNYQDENKKEAFQKLWMDLAQRAFQKYQAVEKKLSLYRKDSRLSLQLAIEYYRGILEKSIKEGIPVLQKRVYLTTLEKIRIVYHAKQKIRKVV